MIVWKRLASAKWEDAWMERLAFLGSRLVAFVFPGGKTLRLEAYDLTGAEAKALVKQFGGQVSQQKDPRNAPPAHVPRKPLAIRNRLWVVESADAAREMETRTPARPAIIVPAAMAFGTGEHATTASCLRLLCDLSASFAKTHTPWNFLDLGTGSGILAIAAKKLGARRAEGCDFDPHAVRTARENVQRNHSAPLPIRKTNVLDWQPQQQWEVVAANLFSQVLVQAAPAITAALRPNAHLILSGILRIQEQEVVQTFQSQGLTFEKPLRKGKWVTLLARKTAE